MNNSNNSDFTEIKDYHSIDINYQHDNNYENNNSFENDNNFENEKNIKSKILFFKSSNEKKNKDNFTVDAINNYVSNLDSCKKLKFLNYFYIDNENEFNVTDKIFCRAKNLVKENQEDISYTLELYSYELKLKNLKEFIEDLKEQYRIEQNNKLGNKKYYFDEHHISLMKNADNTIKFSTAPNEFTFKMTKFNTNKSLKNVFGKHLEVVKERVDLFCNHPEWYEEKGIPYTLGILLHGPPGSGKTSLIKALAKDTNRHIINIRLTNETTKTQLNNLFFNERICVLKNGANELYNIPLDNRIYVLEDIDCDNEILLDRKYKTNADNETKNKANYNKHEYSFEQNYDQVMSSELFNSNYSNADLGNINMNQSEINLTNQQNMINKNNLEKNQHYNRFQQSPIEEDTSEQVTLSFILNLLDGILETPGRILIMTSNFPEKLDKALIRPGRIDINLKVGYCDISMITEMFTFFYKLGDNSYKFEDLEIKKDITPAQLNQILLNNFNNPDKAYTAILNYILE